VPGCRSCSEWRSLRPAQSRLWADFIAISPPEKRTILIIDISGIGQIRLVEDSALAARSFDNDSPNRNGDGEIVSLMDDSTLWPCLLILRLKAENQEVKVVFVLPDSVEKSAFKALSVACRWISMRSDPIQVVTTTKFWIGD
jgi:hypothetical protein